MRMQVLVPEHADRWERVDVVLLAELLCVGGGAVDHAHSSIRGERLVPKFIECLLPYLRVLTQLCHMSSTRSLIGRMRAMTAEDDLGAITIDSPAEGAVTMDTRALRMQSSRGSFL